VDAAVSLVCWFATHFPCSFISSIFSEIEFPLITIKGFSIFLNTVVFFLLLGGGGQSPLLVFLFFQDAVRIHCGTGFVRY
jgi:hypothetical protein